MTIFSEAELEYLRDGSPTRIQELERAAELSPLSLDRLLEIEQLDDKQIEEDFLWEQLNWGRE